MTNLLSVHHLFVCLITFLDIYLCETTDNLSTIEPASTGCPAPDLRFNGGPRKDGITTEPPFAEFETTQIYLPEDFTTADIEFVGENVDIDISSGTLDESGDDRRHKYAEVNPYRIDSDGTDDARLHETDDSGAEGHEGTAIANANARGRNKKRRFTGGKRRRVEKEHGAGHGGGGRGGRYERHTITKRQTPLSNEQIERLQPPPLGKIYYIESVDLLSASFLNKTMMRARKKYKLKAGDAGGSSKNPKADDVLRKNKSGARDDANSNQKDLQQEYKNLSSNPPQNNEQEINENQLKGWNGTDLHFESGGLQQQDQNETGDNTIADQVLDEKGDSNNGTDVLQRVKRKSGKTTGALSRPKGGGDTGSKSTSRKGDKGGFDEEGGYVPFHTDDDEESSEEEKESESTEISHFSHVSEIRFPGEVGPLGDRRLCKIRCVKGKWVGPLCATNEEDDHGNIKFQPLYKSCHVNRIPPHLLLSYRNISVNVGWDLPHGHSLQARCKDLGLYKLLGESRVLCSNGLWAPRMPSCVPTTLLTNYSDDSPPSIRIKIGAGSGAFEPSGVLAVLPGSTIHLDCMYPRRRGTPEWTWTGWFNQANPLGWSPEEKTTKYRLTIKEIQNQDSGTYTCASPRGLTNSIVIVVATSQCPQLPEPVVPLSLRLEGNKLGQRALYRCPLGYTIEGAANSTCLASGNWSSPPPICHPVQCPPLFLEDPHLSLTELNTSAWGRAVFKCSWGFRLSGPPGLECEPTGVWSGPVPRCRAIQCPQPLVPINGRIDGTSGSSSHRRYAVGALVTFSCTEGHLLVGEASIVCTETGFWSHPPPFCKSQCPYPGDPPNGLIAPLKFHYDPGDLLSVQCRPGFVEYGANGPPERPRCLPDGNWSGAVPQCRSYEEV